MTWSRRAARTFARLVAAVPIAAAMLGPAAAVDHWTSPTDAITQLFNARLPSQGTRMPVAACSDFTTLNQAQGWANFRDYVRNPAAGLNGNALNQYYRRRPGAKLAIPMVSVNSRALTIGVATIARSLLSVDLNATAADTMLPTDPSPPAQGYQLVIDEQWWGANLRSAHANADGYLPDPGAANALQAVPNNCPVRLQPPRYGAGAGLAPAQPPNRLETLQALQANTVYTAAQKWHCYARRFNSAGAGGQRADLPVIGLVEVTQREPQYSEQYDQADSRGRLVFDYVNKRVYYNPDHYHRWYNQLVGQHAQFSPVGDDDDPAADEICSPWFEIIE